MTNTCVSPTSEGRCKLTPTTGLFCKIHSKIYQPRYLQYKKLEKRIIHLIKDEPADKSVDELSIDELLKRYSLLVSDYDLRNSFRNDAFVKEAWDKGHDIWMSIILDKIYLYYSMLEKEFKKVIPIDKEEKEKEEEENDNDNDPIVKKPNWEKFKKIIKTQERIKANEEAWNVIIPELIEENKQEKEFIKNELETMAYSFGPKRYNEWIYYAVVTFIDLLIYSKNLLDLRKKITIYSSRVYPTQIISDNISDIDIHLSLMNCENFTEQYLPVYYNAFTSSSKLNQLSCVYRYSCNAYHGIFPLRDQRGYSCKCPTCKKEGKDKPATQKEPGIIITTKGIYGTSIPSLFPMLKYENVKLKNKNYTYIPFEPTDDMIIDPNDERMMPCEAGCKKCQWIRSKYFPASYNMTDEYDPESIPIPDSEFNKLTKDYVGFSQKAKELGIEVEPTKEAIEKLNQDKYNLVIENLSSKLANENHEGESGFYVLYSWSKEKEMIIWKLGNFLTVNMASSEKEIEPIIFNLPRLVNIIKKLYHRSRKIIKSSNVNSMVNLIKPVTTNRMYNLLNNILTIIVQDVAAHLKKNHEQIEKRVRNDGSEPLLFLYIYLTEMKDYIADASHCIAQV